jgi:hypothetical protein
MDISTKEKLQHMYEKHPSFNSPENEDIKIWRYLDIPKFLWLLERKSLYFSRCDLLGDAFEGSLPSTSGQIVFAPLVAKVGAGLPIIDKKNIPISPSIHDKWRKECYICSFHMNDYESAALWSIYTKTRQGIAIQSTFKKLIDSLENYNMNSVFIGTVKYIDYESEIIPVEQNLYLPILHKRKSFEHEREIRAVISQPREIFVGVTPHKECEKYGGLNVPINLDCLIENIYLAPTTKPWIKDLLTSIMVKQGVKKELKQSNLDASPIF